MNRVTLIGNLGGAPRLRTTDSGTPVCNLRMATTERWTQNGQRQERTEWHDITVWGRMAENCGRFLSKGSKVAVEGELRSRVWQTDDGETRRSSFINARTVEFLGGGQRTSSPPPQGGWEPDEEPRYDEGPDDDPIPF
jgi:single-strand DNA-binding protein